jgi:hypothetical protein
MNAQTTSQVRDISAKHENALERSPGGGPFGSLKAIRYGTGFTPAVLEPDWFRF